jgi:peptide/nickel transport system permease protein
MTSTDKNAGENDPEEGSPDARAEDKRQAETVELDAASAGTVSRATLSQWQLIRRRFARHGLAVVSVFVLVILYTLALFAEFFAPKDPDEMNLNQSYAPPQLPKFSFEHGLHVLAQKQQVNPITYEKTYYRDPEEIVPLGFFVKSTDIHGAEAAEEDSKQTKLLGLIPINRKFFGIAMDRYEKINGPVTESQEPVYHFLGADRFGRDLFSRVIHGSRISLSVGILSIALILFFGLILGGISGYVGGKTDIFIQRCIEIIESFPALPLWLALGAVLPDTWNPLQIFIAITVILSLFGWTGLARVTRGKLLALREEDYASAAYLLGASHPRIIFRHLLPGFSSHIIVVLTISVPATILAETALSFLGLGLRPPIVSWGVMLQDAMNLQVLASYPWLLAPVVFIILTVLCFNYAGDGLRDAADPYASR